MRYIKSFNASSDVQKALNDGTLGKPYVAYLTSSDSIDWNTNVNYKELPLTFEFLGGTKFEFHNVNGMQYNYNNGGWQIVEDLDGSLVINNVISGDTLQIKGNLQDWNSYRDGGPVIVANDVPFNVYGNVMSVLDAGGFATATTLPNYAFYFMFKETPVVSAENLILPATTLAQGCYGYMFINCTGLTVAPSILPATTLADGCYVYMFNGCASLTTSPELPATTLANSCYSFMFQGCSSLNYIKCLATDLSASYCTRYWVSGVYGTGTFIKNANMSGWETGASGIPEGWTIINA